MELGAQKSKIHHIIEVVDVWRRVRGNIFRPKQQFCKHGNRGHLFYISVWSTLFDFSALRVVSCGMSYEVSDVIFIYRR